MIGLTPLITWAVLDPVMKVVITEMQGSSPLEMRVWALRLAVEVTLDVSFELHVWNVGFKLRAWALKWYWDADLEPCVLTLQWCWDADFEPCVLALHEWLWLALRLKHGFCYLITCLQWILDSLQEIPSSIKPIDECTPSRWKYLMLVISEYITFMRIEIAILGTKTGRMLVALLFGVNQKRQREDDVQWRHSLRIMLVVAYVFF